MKVKKLCKNCGKELRTHQYTYCSNRCQIDGQYELYIKNWKLGIEDGCVGLTYSKHIKRYLFKKYDNKCAYCSWSLVNKTSGLSPLEIHHIDGKPTNNKEDNLILLCPNCHSLTENYKGLNKGNGRKNRK